MDYCPRTGGRVLPYVTRNEPANVCPFKTRTSVLIGHDSFPVKLKLVSFPGFKGARPHPLGWFVQSIDRVSRRAGPDIIFPSL